MTAPEHSDALVFFGVTGDLAFKKIFPALQSLVRWGQLTLPINGVGRTPMTVEQLVDRARNSVTPRHSAQRLPCRY